MAKTNLLKVLAVFLAVAIFMQIPGNYFTPVTASSLREGLHAAENFAIASDTNLISDSIVGEIKEERTEFSKTFILDNGNCMFVSYPMPVHYQDDNGDWVDYDNSLLITEEKMKSTASVYKNKKSDIGISFAKESTEEDMVFVNDKEHIVSWGYEDINTRNAIYKTEKDTRTGNEKYTVLRNLTSTVVYESAYPNVDIECISTPVGVKENIILNQPSAVNRFISTYDIDGLTVRQIDDRLIALINSEGEVAYYISAPYMYDANNAMSEGITLQIMDEGQGKLTVRLTADQEWLDAPDRVYPVTIDPSFIFGQDWGTVQCTYIDDANPNTAYGYGSTTGYDGTIYMGTYGAGYYRSLMKINSLPTLNKGDMIVDATVNLHLYQNDFYSDVYISVYEATSSWEQSTVTWNTQPTCSGTLIDYVNIDENNTEAWHEWNITKLVKKWYNGDTNNGFYLKMVDEDACRQCAGFYSSNYPSTSEIRPAFILTYRNNKGLESYWTYTSFGVGSAGAAYINDYSGALSFSLPLASTSDPVMPAGVEMVYNSYMADVKYAYSLPSHGRGWKMNIQQTLFASSKFGLTGESATAYPYVYTDADGTDHYFYKKTEDSVTKYYDEDGLGLELTISGSGTSKTYTVTDKDKNKLIFNSSGLLTRQEDTYGNYIKLNYSSNMITSVEDTTGNKITFTYNASNYITSLTDPDGKTVNFKYTGNKVTEIVYHDNTSVKMSYDSVGLLTSVTDASGYQVTFGYDGKSTKGVTTVKEFVTANGVTQQGQQMTFDRSNYNETISRSAGVDGIFGNQDDCITTYQFDNYGRTLSTQSHTYDKKTDLGAQNYTYTAGTVNATGSNIKQLNRVSENHALGANAVNYVRNASLEGNKSWAALAWFGDTTFTFHSSTTERLYGQESFAIQVTAFNANSAGRVYQDITTLTLGKTYTLSGYVKVTDIFSNVQNFGAFIDATSFNADGTTVDFFSDYITEITDTGINDGWRRVSVTFTVPSNSTKIRVNLALQSAIGTAYFDAIQVEEALTPSAFNLVQNGSLESYTNHLPTYWTNHRGLTLSDTADGIVTDAQHGNAAFRIIGDVANDKILRQDIPVSGTENDIYILSCWAKADAIPVTTTRKFKVSINIIYSDGSVVAKNSANFNPSVSDWQFISKSFDLSDGTSAEKTPVTVRLLLTYSQQGNVAYFDNVQLIKEPAQSYTYDAKGNLVTVVDNAEQNSALKYNADNKLTQYVDPKGYAYDYTYYEDTGSMKTAKTQMGATYTYSYDERGSVNKVVGTTAAGHRIQSSQTVNYPNSGSSEYTVKTYDQFNYETTSVYDAKDGTLDSYTDSTGTTTYTYNEANDILTQVSKDSHTVAYIYDTTYDKLTGIETDTASYTFVYDAFGNRTAVKVGSNTLATYIYGENNGNLTDMQYGNGDSVTYTYDKYGNISETYLNGTLVYQGVADNTGNITKVVDPVNHLQYNYVYDSTGRLISSTIIEYPVSLKNTRKAMFEYDFDLNNNLTQFTALTSFGTNMVLYDYGKDNLLQTVTFQNGKKLSYNYDSLGRTEQITLNTTTPVTTSYTYHGQVRDDGYTYRTNLIRTETSNAFQYRYKYDAQYNMTAVYETVKDASGTATESLIEEYKYDALNQLTQVKDYKHNKRYVYIYDNGGNITSEKVYDNTTGTVLSTNTYTYGNTAWKDLLTAYNGQTLTYDAIGNPLTWRDGMTGTEC